MLECLVDNIYVMLGGRVFQHIFGISIATNRAPLFAYLFLYSYQPNFIPERLKKNKTKLARSFNFKLRYIDGVLSLNSSKVGDYISFELDINDIIYATRSSHSFTYTSKLIFKKRQFRHFPFVRFPFICNNIPAALAYGVLYLSVDTIFESLLLLS